MNQALYRRYRPDTFAEVVGQEHVTVPLMHALKTDRVAHAYLFSGPRGCGKTTSARILARCLNCAEGPTDTPCGTCDSCVELATGGTGSVDVVEIDAASHNGVDDARELRERAAFAPARDAYKIFILDEAHMVTPQGFNALLKLVEEPPPHVRFIFATTEPDKVIGTIRSRTHHYPFRLVPPVLLTDYLAKLCEAEGTTVASGVLPLVVRAGGGSVRDSLSVLDQLMAGSGDEGITYERAIALLGFTDAALLDDAVDALSAADGASLFAVVERVIQTGHEPRRFVEDLLERLRDLLILAAAGEDGVKALGPVPLDQLERMRDQARRLGLERASRAADRVNDALTSMVGATSPRLHLELLCARLVAGEAIQPKALGSETSDRPKSPLAALVVANREPVAIPEPEPIAAAPEPVATEEGTADAIEPAPQAPVAEPDAPPEPPLPDDAVDMPPPPPEAAPEAPVTEAEPSPSAGGSEDAELLRRRWSEVLGTLERRRVTWVLVSQSAQVARVEGESVYLAFSSPQLAERFNGGQHAENVALAIRETLGLQTQVIGEADGLAAAPTARSAPPAPPAPPATPVPPPVAEPEPPRHRASATEDEASDNDDAAPDAGLTGAEAIAQMLGGTVVEDD